MSTQRQRLKCGVLFIIVKSRFVFPANILLIAMAVVIETTAGDLTVDLFLQERPKACLNFIKLCRLKYYNHNLFHTIEHGFIAQTGDPSGAGDGGESVWGVLEGHEKRFFEGEYQPKIRHSVPGLLSMVSLGKGLIGSQFFLTLGEDLTSLDGTHCVIGQVMEGQDVLRILNETICDSNHRPYQDVRITHTVVLEDPFENPRGFREPSRSPSPTADRLRGGRIGADEDIDDTNGKTEQEVKEMMQEREAKARATILEIVGDLPDADMAPPENVLFVCKLNPVTSDEDLEIIFSRFGRVKGCEVIRDRVTGDSLQYAFVEFEDSKTCESAYFKMDNVLIDDRRIHVDFSQSVAKVQWKGKGRGLIYKDGHKGDRLNFGDLKASKGGHGAPERNQQRGGHKNNVNGRNTTNQQQHNNNDRFENNRKTTLNRDRRNDRDERSPKRSDRGERSPRRNESNNRERERERNNRENRLERHENDSRDRRVSRPDHNESRNRSSPQSRRFNYDSQQQSRDRFARNSPSRSHERNRPRDRSSDRSPHRNGKSFPHKLAERSTDRSAQRKPSPHKAAERSTDRPAQRKPSPDKHRAERSKQRRDASTDSSDSSAHDRSTKKSAKKSTKKSKKKSGKEKKHKKSKSSKKSKKSKRCSSSDSDSSSSESSSSSG